MTAACPPPRQTGRADFPHIRLSHGVVARSIHRWMSPTGLAVTLSFSLQARSFVSRLASLTVSSAAPWSCRRVVAHPNRLRGFLSPLRSCQGPLAPRALPRFLATTGLSDSPTARTQLISSLRSLPLAPLGQRPGSPSLPNPTFPGRCPLSPRRVPALLANVSSRRMAGFSSSGRLATLNWCNEADSGSLALRLTGSLHGAPTRRLLPAPSASLHAGRSVRMMNTFQFIS
jgi:hypothetical protein